MSLQLGTRIRSLRESLSFTQEELAEKAGISMSFVSMIERGHRTPYLETLADIARGLNVTLSDLFLDEGGQAPTLPLLAYLGTRRLDRKDVAALIRVARAMFDGKT